MPIAFKSCPAWRSCRLLGTTKTGACCTRKTQCHLSAELVPCIAIPTWERLITGSCIQETIEVTDFMRHHILAILLYFPAKPLKS